MFNRYKEPRAQWSSLSSYVLVTTGAVVGLGNIFSFPTLVAKYGGLFILFYVLCELFVSIPLMFSELLIGRRGKQNPVGSFSLLSMEADASHAWRMIGWLCFVILFLTLSYYSVIAAYPLLYFGEAFKFLSHATGATLPFAISENLITPFSLFLAFSAFLLITLLVVKMGINRGLEEISCLTVPAYFIIFIGLAIYSCSIGNAKAAFSFLFVTYPNQPILPVLFAALSYAFFKLNVGMGSLIVYGSYLPYTVSLARSTVIILCLDAVISLLAYFIIYPLALTQSHGAITTELSYSHLLSIFVFVPYGMWAAMFFFLGTIIAAWTPTIAMAESAAVILIERFSIKRTLAVLLLGLAALILGIFLVASHTLWANIQIHHYTFHNALATFVEQILVPISAILIAIFSGWILSREVTWRELRFYPPIYQLWRLLVRFIAPLFILWILIF